MLALGLVVPLLLAAAPAPVFLSTDEAAPLVAGDAVVLDARGAFAEAPYLPRARVVDWMRLRDGLASTGRLADDAALLAAFAQLGVTDARPVLVYGAADRGWGEEGRIWWTLRYLGHPRVYIIDGGVQAWVAAGRPTMGHPEPGRGVEAWRPQRQERLQASRSEVGDAARRRDVSVLDTRSDEEFRGATPYFSSRGGHVPGALHLEWRALLAEDGRLLPRAELERRVAAAGLRRDQRIIAYCTGGVRSAFVVAVLAHLGFPDAANYAGSWWDWSADERLPVE